MRIGFLSTHPIQYQAPLFRELARCPGVDVEVFFCHDHGAKPSFDREFGQTIQFDVPLLEGYTHRFLRNVSPHPGLTPTGMLNPGIIPILSSGRFDAVVMHGYANVSYVLGLFTPRRRTALLLRGDSTLKRHRRPRTLAAKNAVLPRLFRRIDGFLATGALNAAYYRAYGVSDDRITVAPYSVDNEFFASEAASARSNPASTRRQLGIPESGTVFLYSGKLIGIKRPFDLLEAFARANVGDAATLIFVGDGELRSALETRISARRLGANVRVLGFRNQRELPAIYGVTDVLVLPSESESWGLVVNEAMACGAAAIVSDQVGAAPDLVADPRLVFPVGDVDRLSSIIRALTFSPPLLAEARALAQQRIARWGLRETAEAFLDGAARALVLRHRGARRPS